MIELIKLALRISTNKLDNEIQLHIDSARAEMTRAGIPKSVSLDENNVLITQAIKTYCMYQLTDDINIQEKYFQSFQYQLDCLRKSSWEESNAE